MATKKPESGLVKDALKYARLDAKKKKLQRELELVKDEMAPLEESLSEAFVSEGVQLVRTVAGTVHLRAETWPALVVPDGMDKDEARVALVRLLLAGGEESKVSYNQMSMRTFVKDNADEDGQLPPPFGTYLRAETRHRIGVRGSGE